MTNHLPSRHVLVVTGAVVGLAAVAAVVALYWQTIFFWLAFVVGGRFLWRHLTGARRRPRRDRGFLVRLLEAGALVSGARSAHRALASRRAEERREELHSARLETAKARAEELRSRAEHRKRTREEQEKAERAAYWRGAIDGGRSV